MLDKYPKTILGCILLAPYAYDLINRYAFYNIVYEKGKKYGYEKAIKEIQLKAENAVKKTNQYVLQDLNVYSFPIIVQSILGTHQENIKWLPARRR